MNVMMLTAGEGTRLRPHTQFLPKPAIPFLNIPLFAYSLQLLNPLPLKKVVMNTFHLPAKLKATVNSYKYDYPIHFSDESILLGSGGGLGYARSHFQSAGDFILMNGDEVILPSEKDLMLQALAAHQKSQAIATLLVMDHTEVGTKFGGVWVDEQKKILGFGKNQIPGAKKAFHYIGVGIFSDKIFKYIPEGESNILYDGLMAAIQDGHNAAVLPVSCQWFETGNEQDFKLATESSLKILASGSVESNYLNRLMSLRTPQAQFMNKDSLMLLASKNLRHGLGFFEGYNVIGEDVVIKKNCRLKNCILGPRVQIKNADHLEDKMIINELDVF